MSPEPPSLRGAVPVPTFRGSPATPASDLHGRDLDGQALDVRVVGARGWFLLLFLSSGCVGCHEWWEVAAGPGRSGVVTDETVIAVTRGDGREDPAAVRRLAGATTTVIMSDDVWATYRVHGPPFFVLVDGTRGIVATEGVAWAAEQVAADVRRAREGRGTVAVLLLSPEGPES
ncbi:MAG TPA: hypothetical protein VKG43_01675 [Acidimicrobiales bacterium]|nr:hypothetical protein [Acidimicrobiales bacterium]